MKKILEILEKNNFQVSTDTRKDVRGTVFFAIKGENFDGNKFVEDAIKKGATAAVCSAKINLPNVFVVKNTLTTLQKAATVYRKKFSIPVVVIGGSNGKTTSKDLLADALKTKFNILKTEGSFNNHLGVPLTLLAMKTFTNYLRYPTYMIYVSMSNKKYIYFRHWIVKRLPVYTFS
jgi:UDP-N-acetylmuramoyl-tripeptide--D-alanyl-D-alanine ligase